MPTLLPLLLAVAAAAKPGPTVSSWTEDFYRLDPARWEVQLYTFPANGCNMTASQVTTEGSQLHLHVDRNSDPSLPKSCNGGEIGSKRFFTYGLFTVRMKAPAVKGGVSAFFLMNRWVPQDWEHKEIDIELLGSQPRRAQFTTHDFQNGGKDWKSAATTLDLGFDYSAAFHDYAILWTPERVTWFADGKPIHHETRYVPREPLQIRMNIYLGEQKDPGVVQWLGPRGEHGLPAEALYDTIAYYPLDALPPEYRSPPGR